MQAKQHIFSLSPADDAEFNLTYSSVNTVAALAEVRNGNSLRQQLMFTTMTKLWNTLSILLTVMFCAAVHSQDLALMANCIQGISNCPSNVMAQYPQCGDCSAFVKCAGAARSAVFHCAAGLSYDVGLGVCHFSNVANTSCGSPTTTTTATTTTTTATTTTRGNSGSIPGCINSCVGHANGLYHSCQGCHRYFICYGPFLELQCVDGMEWDNSRRQCVTDSATC